MGQVRRKVLLQEFHSAKCFVEYLEDQPQTVPARACDHLSYFFRLRYQPVSTNGMANQVLYSVLFSNELSKIMVHPWWEQDPDLLALGLRWTAICRLDDRRCWEIEKTN
ncbi:hypothetical protein FOCG_10478 [Fusarium oxysporum f. sp. radicis-lycopersici 26381]|nr:hypothetical protein FOCG_10478 [Fusarium oxysporum f. sp. radicis-lycopersici 26381]